MAGANSINFYKTTNGRGGFITGTKVISFPGEHNNLFDFADRAEQVAGSNKYESAYMKNDDPGNETIDEVKFWLSKQAGGIKADTRIKWGIDKTVRYHHAPFGDYNGTSDRTDVSDAPALDLSIFTVECWCKTSKDYSGGEGAIVNKGGYGSVPAGTNLNYGIRINTANKINAGFEDAADNKYNTTSTLTYNDGIWHWVVVTYDGTIIKLYIDSVLDTSFSTSATPEQNSQPLTIGANSNANNRYYQGQIDEVRVYNRVKDATEISDYWVNGTVSADGRVYQNKFGDDLGSYIAQTIPNNTTAPTGIEWQDLEATKPDDPNIGKMKKGTEIPLWFWRQLDANCQSKEDDRGIFNFSLKINKAGTGSGGGGNEGGGTGGGTGGNPPPGPRALRIVSTADTDDNGAFSKILDFMISLNPDVILFNGDDAYNNKQKGWVSRLKPAEDKGIQVIAALGNHDTTEDGTTGTVQTILNHFGYSNRWHGHDIANVHISVISNNSDDSGSFGSNGDQLRFFENDLKNARANPAIDWIIVSYHKPIWSASSKHPANDGGTPAKAGPAMNKYEADLALCGHNHNTQVTVLIQFNPNNVTSPIIVDSAKNGPYKGGDGLVQVVEGTGGRDGPGNFYSLPGKLSDTPFLAFQNNKVAAVTVVDISSDGLTMTVQIMQTDSTVLHSFSIVRT